MFNYCVLFSPPSLWDGLEPDKRRIGTAAAGIAEEAWMLGGCAVARINSTNARENGGNGQRGNNKTQACDLRHYMYAILIVEHEVGLLRYWTDRAECSPYPMSVPSKERAVCTTRTW